MLEQSLLLNPLHKNLEVLEASLMKYWSKKTDRRQRFDKVKKKIHSVANDIYLRVAQNTGEDNFDSTRSESIGKVLNFNLSSAFDRAVHVMPVPSSLNCFEEELHAYLQEQVSFVSVDGVIGVDYPIMQATECASFFKTSRFERLKKVARVAVFFRPGSGNLECDFTLGGKALCKLRSSLGSDAFDITMSLKRNFHLFQKNKFLDSIEPLRWEEAEQFRPQTTTYVIREKEEVQESIMDSNSEETEDEEFDDLMEYLHELFYL